MNAMTRELSNIDHFHTKTFLRVEISLVSFHLLNSVDESEGLTMMKINSIEFTYYRKLHFDSRVDK